MAKILAAERVVVEKGGLVIRLAGASVHFFSKIYVMSRHVTSGRLSVCLSGVDHATSVCLSGIVIGHRGLTYTHPPTHPPTYQGYTPRAAARTPSG